MGDSGNTAVHATVSEQVMVSAANSKQEVRPCDKHTIGCIKQLQM